MTTMIAISTPRLNLRAFRESDLETFAAYRSDPEVARYQGWTAPYTLEQARAFLKEINAHEPGTPGAWYQVVMERKAEPGIIGDCGFEVQAEDPRQAQIGFTLARPMQGQGYATEAVRAVLGFLFGEYDLHRLIAVCDAENASSARLLERVGMRREGEHIENVWFKGAWGSEFSYAILRREWDSARKAE